MHAKFKSTPKQLAQSAAWIVVAFLFAHYSGMMLMG